MLIFNKDYQSVPGVFGNLFQSKAVYNFISNGFFLFVKRRNIDIDYKYIDYFLFKGEF